MVENKNSPKLHHNHNYYLACFAAGAFACGIINTIVEPLNLIRIKKIIDHQKYQSTASALKSLIHKKQITLGLVPNLIGRSMYGFCRFGFYEIFKDFYQFLLGEERAKNYKIIGWSVAAGLAEAIGCMLYCPWQMIKLKIQISRPGFQYPNNTIAVLKRIYQQQGSSKFFMNLPKQIYQNIPKTILKFILYEKLNQIIYNSSYFWYKQPASESQLPQILSQSPLYASTKIIVSFICGFFSGMILAVPMVTIDKIIVRYYSQNHMYQNRQRTLMQFIAFVYKSEGIGGIFGGTFNRIALISILEGSQWAIYQYVKVLNGWETTGSSKIY